ncbi:helix-turn-helix transcriptional regulator [Sphingobacterium sp. SRCM116780]|uniref:winged helix-turn-helix transcriptional regulator n=1 Tax=Sphingobacterium sp. SRCM116780 TaxID=2907623 RepID=UPI001F3D312D|nr:helix-turn-helix domain-containing protein [Sphingobacterium sp. SRCM116780]UIR56972.1 helix-turn-helix transcriptional regulator [Sphingobacterium sp. SRCM116780]
MRKEKSTNSLNEQYLNKNCGITFTMSKIDGRWKINILAFLMNNKKLRYSELKNRLEGISERMLISKLKELEQDGLINRIVHQQIPPKVEYELTALAYSLKDILLLMDQWGEENLNETKK